jgi:hypothetical protein
VLNRFHKCSWKLIIALRNQKKDKMSKIFFIGKVIFENVLTTEKRTTKKCFRNVFNENQKKFGRVVG